MKILDLIKTELKGWKKVEIITLSAVFTIIIVNSILTNDSIIAVISAMCGILYTAIAGKGKISCYFFGLMGSACYSYLSWKSAIYGNLILYACYYIPMQILGIFKWKNNLKKETLEIIKVQFSKSTRIKLLFFTSIICLITIIFLYFLKDSNCVIDGITTVLSILGMYMTVKRNIEQWYLWIIVNGLSLIMWINIVLHGMKAYSTVIMWAVYVVIAFYFCIQWQKELKDKNYKSR